MSPARLALLLGGLGALVLVASASAAPRASTTTLASQSILVMPGPAKGPRAKDRLDRNDDCVTCHADIASDWSHSLHRQSYTDPMFQTALQREREPAFCRSCHAPEASPSSEPSTREAEAGVACVTCHLTQIGGQADEILAAPKPDFDDSRAPHVLRREPEFARADACARCHEFWFPSGGRAGHELKMQRTVAEHARSAFANDGCQSCHMAPVRSGGAAYRGHRFAVVGQPATLRSAVTIEATRPEPGRVVLELEPGTVGHAFPTGDLFRRLAIEVHSADEGPAWSDQRLLARHFGGQRVGKGHVITIERDDDRVGIGSGPRVVEFELPAELHDRPVLWMLFHERVLESSVGAEHNAQVWDRSEVARGTLNP